MSEDVTDVGIVWGDTFTNRETTFLKEESVFTSVLGEDYVKGSGGSAEIRITKNGYPSGHAFAIRVPISIKLAQRSHFPGHGFCSATSLTARLGCKWGIVAPKSWVGDVPKARGRLNVELLVGMEDTFCRSRAPLVEILKSPYYSIPRRDHTKVRSVKLGTMVQQFLVWRNGQLDGRT